MTETVAAKGDCFDAAKTPDRDLLAWRSILLLAVALRLGWCWISPARDKLAVSDVQGYLGRAAEVSEQGLFGQRSPSMVFQAPGTHWLLALCLRVAQGDAGLAIHLAAVCWLVFSTVWVLATVASARLLLPPRAARWVSLGIAIWWPSIRMAGFPMSEQPASALLALSVWAALALARDSGAVSILGHGKARPRFTQGTRGLDDRRAATLGICAALTIAVRHEALLILAPCLAVAVFRRRSASGPTRGAESRAGRTRTALLVMAPIAAMLIFLAAHAAHHRGRALPLAWSAPVNRTLVTCHAVTLRSNQTNAFGAELARDDGWPGSQVLGWRPAASVPNWVRSTELGALASLADEHPLALDPALGEEIVLRAPLEDLDALADLRRRCLAASSALATTRRHVLAAASLLLFVRPWPTLRRGPLDGEIAAILDPAAMLAAQGLALCLALFSLLRVASAQVARAAARVPSAQVGAGLLAAMLIALLVVGAIYGGGARVRAIYDGPLLLLAGHALVVLWRLTSGRGAGGLIESARDETPR